MKKDLIKILVILGVLLSLSGCVEKSTNKPSPEGLNLYDYDAVLNVGGKYEIFENGTIEKKEMSHYFISDGLSFKTIYGDVAIYKRSDEIAAVINQINLMEHGNGDGFQNRIIFFGEDRLYDYEIGNIIPFIDVDTIRYYIDNGENVSDTSVYFPKWEYLVYTCPIDSKSALELAREQMGLNLK